MARYCCDHRCNSGRELCARRIEQARLQRTESAAKAMLLTERDLDRNQDAKDSKPMPLPELLMRKGSMQPTNGYPTRPLLRAVLIARRAYRVLWVIANTIVAKSAANQEPKP